MVTRPPLRASERKRSTDNSYDVEFIPVQLSEADDDARIKRLSKQIIECIERVKRDRRSAKRDRIVESEIFTNDLDKRLGLDS